MQLVTRDEVEDLTRPPSLNKEKYFKLAIERGLVSTNGDFFLMGANVFLNINVCGWTNYHFVSEEAARNYYDLFCKNVHYPVVLCRKIKDLS